MYTENIDKLPIEKIQYIDKVTHFECNIFFYNIRKFFRENLNIFNANST